MKFLNFNNMKQLLFCLCIIINLGCQKNNEIFIKHLNGYWEIEKVILPSGEEHVYNYNEFIDYFNVNDSLKGFRKKLKPTLNGTFEASNDAEKFVLQIEQDSLNIYYQTNFANWKETILFANEKELKIINAERKIYIYKSFKPINLN